MYSTPGAREQEQKREVIGNAEKSKGEARDKGASALPFFAAAKVRECCTPIFYSSATCYSRRLLIGPLTH
jgi:hypothetical protein